MATHKETIRNGLTAQRVRKEVEMYHQLGKMEYFDQSSKLLGTSGSLEPKAHYLRTNDGLVPLKLIARTAYARHNKGRNNYVPGAFAWALDDLGFRCLYLPETKLSSDDEKAKAQYYRSLARPQQAKFRQLLLDKRKRCEFTGCGIKAALEAAHIVPKSDGGPDTDGNGFLLRADVHRLFDAKLISVSPKSGKLRLHKSIRDSYQSELVSFVDLSDVQIANLKIRSKLAG